MTAGGNAEEPALVVEVDGFVAVLRLNRPERRNAIDLAMRSELASTLGRFAVDDAIRVVMLTGSGSAFCSGVDLKDATPFAVGDILNGATARVTEALDRFPKPVIAAVNGSAYGGGCELALAADLRVASTDAVFCLPEVRIGSLPGSGGTQRLAAAVPAAVAAKMLYLGDPIDASEAYRVGLVSDLCAPDALLERTSAMAHQIAANAPLSVLALKRSLAASAESSGAALERALWALLAMTEDRAEGRAAFREHRPPRYTGR